MRATLWTLAVIAVLCLSVAVAVGQYGGMRRAALPSLVAGSAIGGPFTLVDHYGQRVSEASWPGTYRLMFFGFTYCPSICPTELQKISSVLATLPADQAAKLTPLFITVDPARDDAAALTQYLSNFDPRIVGLTGTVDQVAVMLKAYRIYAAVVKTGDGAEDYTMDHSAYTYLMDSQNRLVALYRTDQSVGQIVDDLKNRLQ